ncbi:hypothetical protein INT47_007377 [Mucor saturninus]|uniref:Uncharacterized protein n=1 Tax=Mucor saturninus TaxID=64648 RepID=A0A8H7V278_9FUNG|nr:hypothetical protein INT47_007377 [Mucor saturninus]
MSPAANVNQASGEQFDVDMDAVLNDHLVYINVNTITVEQRLQEELEQDKFLDGEIFDADLEETSGTEEKNTLTFVRAHKIYPGNGCYLFNSITDAAMTECPQCNAKRRAGSVVKMVDIGDHLARLLARKDFRKEVEQYREVIDAIEEGDPYTDFFSGLEFKELKEKDLFSGKHDLAIVLCVDGFTSKVSQKSMVMVHVIIPSIDPSIRYTDEYTFQVAIFLSLYQLSRQPLIVKRNGEYVTTSNVFCFGVIADGVEINQRLLMFGGHMVFHGCRFCLAKGVHPVEEGKNGMYFIQRNAPIRSKTSLLLPDADNNYGIKKASPFGELNTFLGIDFFFCDELHMFSNVSNICFDLLFPGYNTRFKFVGNESNYLFLLSPANLEKIKISMNDSRCYMSTDFSSSFKGMHSDNVRSMYRSVDWIAWLLYVVPTIVAPLLPSSCATKPFIALSRGIKLSLQWVITGSNKEPSVLTKEEFGQLCILVSFTLGKYPFIFWIKALLHCFIRQEGDKKVAFTQFHADQTIIISAKLWCNNQVLISDLYKSKNTSSSRGGEFMMFKAVHQNLQFRSVERWYVCKALFFSNFCFRDGCGSHYIYGELMKTHEVSPYSKAIPRVKPYADNEQKKYVVFDADDIMCSVGLVNAADQSSNMYVISTGDAFEEDIKASKKLINTSHTELSENHVQILNRDWLEYPQLRFCGSQLLAGAIIIEGQASILCNTIEPYGRDPLLDAHYERSPVISSFPNELKMYGYIRVCILNTPDGQKLTIGTRTCNFLVTSSMRLDINSCNIGPATSHFRPSDTSRVFLDNSSIQSATNMLNNPNVNECQIMPSLSQLRQVRSKFDCLSMYSKCRASSTLASHPSFQPITIWTLISHNSSTTRTLSQARVASLLFRLIASKVFRSGKAATIKLDEVQDIVLQVKEESTSIIFKKILDLFKDTEEILVIGNASLNSQLVDLANIVSKKDRR